MGRNAREAVNDARTMHSDWPVETPSGPGFRVLSPSNGSRRAPQQYVVGERNHAFADDWRLLMRISRGMFFLPIVAAAMACVDSRGPEHALLEPRAAARGEGPEASDVAHLDLNVERAGLLAADRAYSQFSATTNLVEGTMNMVAPAIIYIAPGTYITTAAQVRTLLQSNPANLTAVLTWSAVRADVLVRCAARLHLRVHRDSSARRNDRSRQIHRVLEAAERRYVEVGGLSPQRSPGRRRLVDGARGFRNARLQTLSLFPENRRGDRVASVFATDLAFSDRAQSGVSDAFVAFAAPDAAVLGRLAGIGFGTQAIIENQQDALAGVARLVGELR